MKEKNIDEGLASRVCFERLGTWAREKIQGWVQELLEEEVTELLAEPRTNPSPMPPAGRGGAIGGADTPALAGRFVSGRGLDRLAS